MINNKLEIENTTISNNYQEIGTVIYNLWCLEASKDFLFFGFSLLEKILLYNYLLQKNRN